MGPARAFGFSSAALLRAAESVGKIPESLILVPGRGLEPPRLAAYAPQAYAFTNYTTRAKFILSLFLLYSMPCEFSNVSEINKQYQNYNTILIIILKNLLLRILIDILN